MDGNTAVVLGGFTATWLQIAMLYYKIGKLEAKINNLNINNNPNYEGKKQNKGK